MTRPLPSRRAALALAAGGALALAAPARAQPAPPRAFRIGYQKNGILVIAKQQARIEARLKVLGVPEVAWVEFSFGPPLLEAINAGAIDFGQVGDTPPVFAQAAGAALVYAAAQPAAGSGSAVLLPEGSTIRTIQELRGKRVAFAKGSSAHNLTVAVLEKAGLTYADITPVQLSPGDASTAFARGNVDAWTVWDPYYAVAEGRPGVRVLIEARDVFPQNSFFLASRAFAEAHPRVLAAAVDELGRVAAWARDHRGEVAGVLSAGTGVPLEPTRRAVDRTDFVIEPVSPAVVREQQAVADRFHRLGLIPRAIDVASIVWTPPGT